MFLLLPAVITDALDDQLRHRAAHRKSGIEDQRSELSRGAAEPGRDYFGSAGDGGPFAQGSIWVDDRTRRA